LLYGDRWLTLQSSCQQGQRDDTHTFVKVRAKWDGTYDKTNLPDELIVTSYFSLRDDKIVGLTIIVNEPSPY